MFKKKKKLILNLYYYNKFDNKYFEERERESKNGFYFLAP